VSLNRANAELRLMPLELIVWCASEHRAKSQDARLLMVSSPGLLSLQTFLFPCLSRMTSYGLLPVQLLNLPPRENVRSGEICPTPTSSSLYMAFENVGTLNSSTADLILHFGARSAPSPTIFVNLHSIFSGSLSRCYF